MRRNTRLIAGLGIALLGAWTLTATGAKAQQGQPAPPDDLKGPHTHPPSDIVAVYPLLPETGSEVLLDGAVVQVTRQGHRIFGLRTRTRAKRLEMTFDWVADADRGTYRTFRQFGRPGERERVRQYMEERRYPDLFAPRARRIAGLLPAGLLPAGLLPAGLLASFGFVPPSIRVMGTPQPVPGFDRKPAPSPVESSPRIVPAQGPCNCCPTCECGGLWFASGETRDIFGSGVLLNYTQARVNWTSQFTIPESNLCAMETYTTLVGCTALAPSDLGTNWYTAGCYDMSDGHGTWSDRYGKAQTTGIYYNYDFGWDSEVTWVQHDVAVAVDGNSTYAYQGWEAGGEFYWGLGYGTFSQYGSNSCTM